MEKLYRYTYLLLLSIGIVSCGQKDEAKEENTNDTIAAAQKDSVATDTIKIHGKIEFPSLDGLTITADSYEILPGERYVLLCHQAGFSRGEYKETAARFNELGYNCLAIDQRSGEVCNDVVNETAKLAKEQKKKTEYTDAEQDILAAIDYIHKKSGHKVIVVGSSYSAALALKIAASNENVSALALFSPGEYLNGIKLNELTEKVNVPVFATSSKKEAKEVATLLERLGSAVKDVFVPASDGEHGSKVLWPNSPSREEYWNALIGFLNKIETTL